MDKNDNLWQSISKKALIKSISKHENFIQGFELQKYKQKM